MINTELFFLIFNLSHKSSLLDQVMVFGANYLIFLMFVLVVILGIKKRSSEPGALLVLISLPLVLIIAKMVHVFFYQPRPFVTFPIETLINHSASASFPSLHTSIAFTLAFSFLLTKSRWGKILVILATWIGFSRIFVGVHYPLDILGGILAALISILLALWFRSLLASKGDPLRA